MNRPLAGFFSGVVATAPMTATMIALHRLLPTNEKYPLPPYVITMKAAADTKLLHKADDPEKQTEGTLLAHFGFGGFAGVFYGLIGSWLPLPSGLKGVIYGLSVWGISYLAVLPLLGLYLPPTREPARRLGLMVAAHLVWGPVMAILLERLAPSTETSTLEKGTTYERKYAS